MTFHMLPYVILLGLVKIIQLVYTLINLLKHFIYQNVKNNWEWIAGIHLEEKWEHIVYFDEKVFRLGSPINSQNFRSWSRKSNKSVRIERIGKHPITIHCCAAIIFYSKSNAIWYVKKMDMEMRMNQVFCTF